VHLSVVHNTADMLYLVAPVMLDGVRHMHFDLLVILSRITSFTQILEGIVLVNLRDFQTFCVRPESRTISLVIHHKSWIASSTTILLWHCSDAWFAPISSF